MLRRALNANQPSQRRQRQQASKQVAHEKPTIKLNQWLHGFKGHNTQAIKRYVMNFFISQGLFDVAQQFSKQANIPMPNINQEQVRARYQIKQFIQQGKIDDGLEQLQKLCKKKRKTNQQIKDFKQKQMQAIQLSCLSKKNQTILNKVQQKVLEESQSAHKNSEMIQQSEEKSKQQSQHQQNNSQKQLKPPNQQCQQEHSQHIQSESTPIKKFNLKVQLQQKFIKSSNSQQNFNQLLNKQQDNNQYDIFALGDNEDLLFNLKCLKVINLIKQNKIKESIEVAKKQLVPYTNPKKNQNGKMKMQAKGQQKQKQKQKHQNNQQKQKQKQKQKHQQYLQKIQKVMSLIAFLNHKDSPNYQLTTPQYRMKIAGQLNNLLLGDECQGQTITALLKLCKWCQKRLQAHLNFPKLNITGNQIYAFTR